eukprot:jgi/Ulvmu1/6059/UM027_0037.1
MESEVLTLQAQRIQPLSQSSSPSGGSRPGTRGSVSNINWLSCNRHVTEKQLFAHVTSEMQWLLASSATGTSRAWPNGREHGLRHHGRKRAQSTDFGYVEIFPRNATETPALLSSIERHIAAASYDANSAAVPQHVRAALTAAPAAAGSPGAARASLSANAAFNIYSQALDEFIAGFPSYAQLMREIKGELDGAVNDAVRCAKENVALRQQRTEARRAREAAVEEAYKKAAAAAGDFRRNVHKKLIALEERQIDAQRRAVTAAARSHSLSADITAARRDVARLLQANQRLRAAGKVEEDWPRGPRETLAMHTLGPVTTEMERALDPDAVPEETN